MFVKLPKMKHLSFLLMLVLTLTSVNFAQKISESNAKFVFNLIDGKNKGRTTFEIGEEVFIEAYLDNNTNEMFPLYLTGEYYQYRFSLYLIGKMQPIPYREDRARILSVREEKSGIGRQLMADSLFPGEKLKLGKFKLSDRFENLKTGKYKLKIEYKTGKFIVTKQNKKKLVRLSYTLEFEIISKEKSTHNNLKGDNGN